MAWHGGHGPGGHGPGDTARGTRRARLGARPLPEDGRGWWSPTCAQRRCPGPVPGRGRGGAGAASRRERLPRTGGPSGQPGTVPGAAPWGWRHWPRRCHRPGWARGKRCRLREGPGAHRDRALSHGGDEVAGDAGQASRSEHSAEGWALGSVQSPWVPQNHPQLTAAPAAEGTCPITLPKKPEK